jgi:hypothetical protein
MSEKTPRGGQSVYLFDKFIENADKTMQEAHIDKFEEFIKQHQNSSKQTIQDYSNTEEDFSSVWDETQFPIKFNHIPVQKDPIQDLLTISENELLRKVLMTLSYLCGEMNYLQRVVRVFIFHKTKAKEKFYPVLNIFGETVKEIEDGEPQLMFSRSLPTFMSLWNFCERCNIVVKNVVQQLASLYSKFNKLEKERFELMRFTHIHFMAVYTTLAEFLGDQFSFLTLF